MYAFLVDAGRLWMAEITPTLIRYTLFAVGVWFALWVLLAGLIRARKIREPPAAAPAEWCSASS